VPFDEEYYRRFYADPATRVNAPEEIGHVAQAITSLLAWWRYPLGSVLDVGAGTGEWGRWLAAHRPEVAYRSCDVSEHACRTYGHEQRDISAWRADEEFDLVVCQGVLGYLDDAACARAIDNLAHMTRGFLWLGLTTSEDLERGVANRERTDLSMHMRPASFYFELLGAWYVRVGAGLFMYHHAGVPLYAVETLD
jgi:SAM-dependent methyltransferase